MRRPPSIMSCLAATHASGRGRTAALESEARKAEAAKEIAARAAKHVGRVETVKERAERLQREQMEAAQRKKENKDKGACCAMADHPTWMSHL